MAEPMEANLPGDLQAVRDATRSRGRGPDGRCGELITASRVKVVENVFDADNRVAVARRIGFLERKDIDSLELWTKVINIAAVPLAVAIAGLALGMARKQKTKAQ